MTWQDVESFEAKCRGAGLDIGGNPQPFKPAPHTPESNAAALVGQEAKRQPNPLAILKPADQLAYILSAVKPGRSLRFTLVSLKSGDRITYQVKTVQGVGGLLRRYVSVLQGSEYIYLGTVFNRGERAGFWWWTLYGWHESQFHYFHGKVSSISEDSKEAKTFAWLWSRLAWSSTLPGAELWHEGRCGRCGIRLTVPESIARGLGPTCYGKATQRQ